MLSLKEFFFKMKGSTKSPPRVSWKEIILSWIGGFTGISVLGIIHYKIIGEGNTVMLIGSYGASAVLVFGAIKSPLAQPRNLVGGHVVSAFSGVMAYQLLGYEPWLAGAVGVATAIALMHITKTLHPPGGATALIAVIGGDKIHNLGLFYCIVPAFTGSLILLLTALIVNNIPEERKYPEFWF